MVKYFVESHDFKIIDCPGNICQIKFCSTEGKAFEKARRKLYIIQSEIEVLYIGESNCSIKTRFQRACSSHNYFRKNKKARGGYKGYKWLNKKDNILRDLNVTVAVFNSSFDADKKRAYLEAVEGELVYLIRNNLKYWPKFQNEIHFRNMEGANEIASEIFKKMHLK